ncbi:MAG: MmcQ/YjbR family DNA-binding protein [Rhizomicrobium sp.]|jgi:predicted DNA-binding protein (MmcQ/YjbR family)
MGTLEKSFQKLRELALAYPEAHEDHPWGETAIKVRGKTFLFMGLNEGKLGLSLKLTNRHEFALQYPFVAPTRYGLGKSGWITSTFSAKDKPPLDVLSAWIDDSYRAIAPRKIVAQLETKPPQKRTASR